MGERKYRFNTSEEVITALGGIQVVARWFGVDPRVVWNWKVRGFPPDTFYAFHYQLTRDDLSAPPSLWHQRVVAGRS